MSTRREQPGSISDNLGRGRPRRGHGQHRMQTEGTMGRILSAARSRRNRAIAATVLTVGGLLGANVAHEAAKPNSGSLSPRMEAAMTPPSEAPYTDVGPVLDKMTHLDVEDKTSGKRFRMFTLPTQGMRTSTTEHFMDSCVAGAYGEDGLRLVVHEQDARGNALPDQAEDDPNGVQGYLGYADGRLTITAKVPIDTLQNMAQQDTSLTFSAETDAWTMDLQPKDSEYQVTDNNALQFVPPPETPHHNG